MISGLQTSMNNLNHPQSLSSMGPAESSLRDSSSFAGYRSESSTLVPQRREGGSVGAGHPPSASTRALFGGGDGRGYPSKGLSLLIGILGMIALGISTYLMYHWATKSSVAGCDGSIFSCDHVLNSRYSQWMGIPVTALAAMTYICLLVSLGFAQFGSISQKNISWSLVVGCCLAAGLAAAWFIYLQYAVIGHWCKYCLMAHACGIVLALIVLKTRPVGMKINGIAGGVAAAGLVVVSLGQAFGEESVAPTYVVEIYEQNDKAPEQQATYEEDVFDPPTDDSLFEAPDFGCTTPVRNIPSTQITAQWLLPLFAGANVMMLQDNGNQDGQQDGQATDESSKSSDESEKLAVTERRLAEIAGGTIKLDVKHWPLAGNADADYVFVEMFDYNCPDCRQTHATVKAVKEKFGDKLAIIVLPLPLNRQCNDQIQYTAPQFTESCLLANLAVAVWKADTKKFAEFHDWMFAEPNAPSYQRAKAYADELIGKKELDEIVNSQVPEAFIKKHVQIYQRLNRGNIPKLLLRDAGYVGRFQSVDQLTEALNKQGPIVPTPIN